MVDVAKISEPALLRTLMKNAESRGSKHVYWQAFNRLCRLQGMDQKDPLSRDFYAMLAAYEELLTKKHGRTTKASRTRQKLAKKGVIRCLEDWSLSPQTTAGFKTLMENGLVELTGEYLVTKYADRFSPKVIAAARARLSGHVTDTEYQMAKRHDLGGHAKRTFQASDSAFERSKLTPIADRSEAKEVFKAFRVSFQHGAEVFADHRVGHRGATQQYDVYWHPLEGIWGLFADRDDLERYWICFGNRDPGEYPSLMITVEINPPKAGVNRQCAGAFLKDTEGHYYVGHSGKVGGGRKGIGQEAFRQFADEDDWSLLLWPDGASRQMKIIGRVDSPNFVERLSSFVHEVDQFKDWATSGDKAESFQTETSQKQPTSDRATGGIGNKYARLYSHLANLEGDEWRARFSEVEDVLEFSLPRSARKYAAWWSNSGDLSQTSSWARAGWRTSQIRLHEQTVLFRRADQSLASSSQLPDAFASVSKPPLVVAEKGVEQSLDRPSMAGPEVRCDLRYAWVPCGELRTDAASKLVFPAIPPQPGLYRFEISHGDEVSLYVGEADNLQRRFYHYRNPGSSQATNIRINDLFVAAMKQGARISVALIVDNAWIAIQGVERPADLSVKAERVLLEQAAIVLARSEGIDLLNR